MEFLAVTFTNIPVIRYAHSYETERSAWEISAHDKLMEITMIETGGLIIKDKDSSSQRILKEGNIFTIPHNNYAVETTGNYHKHTTIAVTPDKISAPLAPKDVVDMSVDVRIGNSMTSIIPMAFESGYCGLLAGKIKKASHIFNSSDVLRNIKSTALLMDILSFSTEASVEMAQKEFAGIREYNHMLYCQQAMRYIANHIREPINVEDIAQHLNISYGHLSRLFKKQINCTLVDYINKEKVRKMEELLWSKNMSVSEVAQSVGITDEKYASRLFRRYTGLTVGSYIKLKEN